MSVPDSTAGTQSPRVTALPPEALRWRCDGSGLTFQTTAEVEPLAGIVGQDDAIDALRFGLETEAPGQNVFVRGLTGTGRMTTVQKLLEGIRPHCPLTRDRCFVHNFRHPDRPRLITLPPGAGQPFKRRIGELAKFILEHLGPALSTDSVKERRTAINDEAERAFRQVMDPFNEALGEAGLTLVSRQAGPVTETGIFPLIEGEPVSFETLDKLIAEGKLTNEQRDALQESKAEFEKRLAEISEQTGEIRRQHEQATRTLLEEHARTLLQRFTREIARDYDLDSVRTYLDEVVDDVLNNRLGHLLGSEEFETSFLYKVNVVIEHQANQSCPIIVENTPSMRNLLGAIDYDFSRDGEARSTHMGITAGSLLRADGGYLIVEARDLLSEPGGWKVLVRTLRTGQLEITPPELAFPWAGPSIKPEAIDVRVKVILIGDADMYYLLDAHDRDFPNLFKVLADFDTTIPRNEAGIAHYAGVVARVVRDEKLLPFDRDAVCALVEHGARIAARRGKLTARFGRLADVAREASFVAGREDRERVGGDDVREAVRRNKRRADLPARRFREYIADGSIRVQTSGKAVGQVNGLAVLSAGPLTYGFPARITATIGPGTAGVINIEREAALSGAIHTKGFYILGGLLRHLLRTEHPLAFNASIAFEQSYGGIDGDSASGAEVCCLLSALTEMPIRQDMSMTGAIDQVGNILPIGGVNEKIEGFFDACNDLGLTGTQGVLIPQANAGDLILRHDVVEACAAGRFHVYAVATVHEALTLLTDTPAGGPDPHAKYAEGTLLHKAVKRAREYWKMAAAQPQRPGDSEK